MVVLRKSNLYTIAQLQSLHRTRLHLQLTWSSKIVSSNGVEVIKTYLKATTPPQTLERDEWLQQPPPNKEPASYGIKPSQTQCAPTSSNCTNH
eukprot:2749507-Ditylum_brightwellii.AAC.1